MGVVLLAQDTELERSVALKVMSPDLAKDPEQRKRFRQEAKAASALVHPNICVIHEVGETEDGRLFLAMEYVEGQTLDAIMQERRPSLRETLNLGLEVAEALDAAHLQGVVHRDIKPANLMLDRRGHAKVLDFGLAKRLAQDELGAPITPVARTQTGMLIGTPTYMSPEQVLGQGLEPSTDIFSLGVVLYELVAGQRPFLGRTVGETMNNIVNQAPVALGLNQPVFSPRLEEIIFKCLEKDPAKRYKSAGELAADLRWLKDEVDRTLSASPPREGPAAAASSAPGRSEPTKLWQLMVRTHKERKAALGWVISLIITAVLALGGWLMFHRGGLSGRTSSSNPTAVVHQPSVGVLPFVNLSAAKTDEYLSDGISEEIITALSKIKGLKVPARTSCFAFKGNQADLGKIGQQLHVSTVLEGSVSKVGNRLHVTAQLINIADGFHVWSETYDRDIDDLLAIRTDVAARVAEALKGQLLGEDRRQLSKRTTDNAAAHRLYLQGRYLWNRRTGENLKQSIEHFSQAIGQDPSYALAYAGLADCYVVLSQYTGLPARETYPKARAAALKALELDGSLGEPHATLGFIRAFFDWDWGGAEAEFLRAIELAPNYATAHHWFARVLDVLRRHEQALAEGRRAQEIDPLSPVINANLGLEFYLTGKEDLAAETLQDQIALDPSFVVAHDGLGLVYLKQGKLSQAVTEFETMHRLDGSGAYGLGDLGLAYARAGRTNDAQKMLLQMEELQQKGQDCRVAIALVQHALGQDMNALESLDQAMKDRASGLEWVNFAPFWQDLAQHPRARSILKQMNLAK